VGFAATRYVLDGTGFETMAGQVIFSSRHPSRPALRSIRRVLQKELRLLPPPRLSTSRALPLLLHVCLRGMYGVVFTLLIIL
jgi:hypothetical protein